MVDWVTIHLRLSRIGTKQRWDPVTFGSTFLYFSKVWIDYAFFIVFILYFLSFSGKYWIELKQMLENSFLQAKEQKKEQFLPQNYR